jgi:long-subunit fatty acid transport protein
LQGALEAAWIRRDWSFFLGATYKHWSAYPGPIEPTILCPADNPDCNALQPTKLAFSDTLVPRVGAERRVPLSESATLALRGGYFFEPTPAPSSLDASSAFDPASRNVSPVPTRFFDTSRHVITWGMGVTLTKPLHLTIDYSSQIHVLQPRDVTIAAGANGAPSTGNLHGLVWMNAIGVGVGF